MFHLVATLVATLVSYSLELPPTASYSFSAAVPGKGPTPIPGILKEDICLVNKPLFIDILKEERRTNKMGVAALKNCLVSEAKERKSDLLSDWTLKSL